MRLARVLVAGHVGGLALSARGDKRECSASRRCGAGYMRNLSIASRSSAMCSEFLELRSIVADTA